MQSVNWSAGPLAFFFLFFVFLKKKIYGKNWKATWPMGSLPGRWALWLVGQQRKRSILKSQQILKKKKVKSTILQTLQGTRCFYVSVRPFGFGTAFGWFFALVEKEGKGTI